MLNRQHDPPPNGMDVDHLLAFADGFVNVVRGAFGGDGERLGTHAGAQHFGGHESRFDGQHMHAVTREAIPQGFEVGGESRFGGVVAGVGDAAAVARHGRDAHDLSAFGFFEQVADGGQPGNRARQVDLDHLDIVFSVHFFWAGRIVHPRVEDEQVQPAQVRDDFSEQGRNLGVVAHVMLVGQGARRAVSVEFRA